MEFSLSTRRSADFNGDNDGDVFSSLVSTRAMFLPPLRIRNIGLLVCVCGFLAGCGAQMFLRVDRLKVDDRLLYFLGGGGNSFAFLHGAGEAFLSDPKLGPGANELHGELEGELGRTVRRVLLTHSHGDHVSGLPLYDAPVVLVHPRTRARLEALGRHANWVEVDHELLLQLGAERVRVLSLGGGHTDGDLVALFEARRLLIVGDLVLEHTEPRIDVAAGGSLLALADTLERLLGLDFERVLPGHGAPVTRADVVHLRDYLRALEAAARAARRAGLDEATAVQTLQVPGFDDLRSVPFVTSRETNVRLMLREVAATPRP
jgi:glyoxylase-like metal-dependent hydrolase (beta-lactamase superfamily II)